MRILVTGAGGFIGHHLVNRLVREGHFVRGVDQKLPEFERSVASEFEVRDLRRRDECFAACRGGIERVFQLAADMGGMGFITTAHYQILRNSGQINSHMLEAAILSGVKRMFFSSSACIYPQGVQDRLGSRPLREQDAYPADPQDAYGWEKLLAEQALLHAQAEFGIEARIARFHNTYGPLGAWRGGREKAPAALCRKVALAKLAGYDHIEVWGDGLARRTYTYIADCIDGILRIMDSGYMEPINLGTTEAVSVDELAHTIMEAAGHVVPIKHIPGPQGVRDRNTDNALIQATLGWEPRYPLREGIGSTYHWIEEQVMAAAG